MTRDLPPDSEIKATLLVRRMGHDFNNLLSIMLGGLSLLRDEIDESAWNAEAREVYEDVVSAAREAADVVAQLTAWAQRQALEPERCELNELVASLQPLLARALPDGLSLEVRTVPGAVEAWCDRARLQDAVFELVANARDALAPGGTIAIATRSGPEPGISVSDTGTGMSAEILAACLEPYFTTRRESGHRGLGLSVVHGFANASGGRLELRSASGQGTHAALILPARAPRRGSG